MLAFLVEPLVSPSSRVLAHKGWLLQTLLDSITSVEGWAERYLATGWLEVPEVRDEDLERVVRGLVGAATNTGNNKKVLESSGGEDDADVGARALMDAWDRAVEVNPFA